MLARRRTHFVVTASYPGNPVARDYTVTIQYGQVRYSIGRIYGGGNQWNALPIQAEQWTPWVRTCREALAALVAAGPPPGIGDTVRIYDRSHTNVQGEDGRVEIRRERCGPSAEKFVIVRANRHGDWTVQDPTLGSTHDVFRPDVEHAEA
jgi:hypothetical protein